MLQDPEPAQLQHPEDQKVKVTSFCPFRKEMNKDRADDLLLVQGQLKVTFQEQIKQPETREPINPCYHGAVDLKRAEQLIRKQGRNLGLSGEDELLENRWILYLLRLHCDKLSLKKPPGAEAANHLQRPIPTDKKQ
ncbi:unnamed protein product [Pleuronectes platessa]|uniref:Uncharacterized protein n=1 Tax=Pleuronectes platessa TaxID=8262 RepID=A0A9N7U0T9_PLEPL|nr:unnamed protein product [Pleuronectes platessa]